MPKDEPEDFFRDRARNVFAFLFDDFGFEEELVPKDRNQFAIWLINPTTRIVVESISYGYTCRVALGKAGEQKTFENYDLLDLVTVSEKTKKEIRARKSIRTFARTDLPILAELLLKYGKSVIRGDFSNFAQIRAIIDKRKRNCE